MWPWVLWNVPTDCPAPSDNNVCCVARSSGDGLLDGFSIARRLGLRSSIYSHMQRSPLLHPIRHGSVGLVHPFRGDPSTSPLFSDASPLPPGPRLVGQSPGVTDFRRTTGSFFFVASVVFHTFDEHLRPSSRASLLFSSLLVASTSKMEGTATATDLKKLKVGPDEPQVEKGSEFVAYGRRWS